MLRASQLSPLKRCWSKTRPRRNQETTELFSLRTFPPDSDNHPLCSKSMSKGKIIHPLSPAALECNSRPSLSFRLTQKIICFHTDAATPQFHRVRRPRASPSPSGEGPLREIGRGRAGSWMGWWEVSMAHGVWLINPTARVRWLDWWEPDTNWAITMRSTQRLQQPSTVFFSPSLRLFFLVLNFSLPSKAL